MVRPFRSLSGVQLAVLAAAGLGGACGVAETEAAEVALERGPAPVVLWVVDTLRAENVHAYGYERPTSPVLDRLAGEGVLFERCIAQSTWTRPATASILTGRYPSDHGANREFAPIAAEIPTLAERLGQAGYRTAAFVSNPNLEGSFDRGFAHYQRYYPREGAFFYERAEVLVDDALAWLPSAADEPFFLYVHVLDPHAPYDPPEPWAKQFDRGYDGEVTGYLFTDHPTRRDLEVLEEEDRQRLIDLYDGEIAYADAQFGRLLQGLRDAGRYDEALVVFVSDHGEEFEEHGAWQHNPHMYQEVLSIPLVMRFPGAPEGLAGVRRAALAQQIDIVPTVLDVVGLPFDESLAGRSLLQPLDGDARAAMLAFSEVDHKGWYRRAVVTDRMKLIRGVSPDPVEMLFDLEDDPRELSDLATRRPEVREELKGHLDERLAVARESYYAVLINETGERIEWELLVGSTEPLDMAEPLFEESSPSGARDGMVREGEIPGWEQLTHGTRLHFRTQPGDRDGMLFRPADSDENVAFGFLVDSQLGPAELIRLGADGRQPEALPVWLGRDDTSLEAKAWSPLARARGSGGVRLVVWRTAPVGEGDASDEIRRNLRALGY